MGAGCKETFTSDSAIGLRGDFPCLFNRKPLTSLLILSPLLAQY